MVNYTSLYVVIETYNYTLCDYTYRINFIRLPLVSGLGEKVEGERVQGLGLGFRGEGERVQGFGLRVWLLGV